MINRLLLIGALCGAMTAAPLSRVGGQQPSSPGAGVAPQVAPGGAPLPAAGQAAPGGNLPPTPPFQLSDVEQQQVLTTLQMWEQTSKEIKNFSAEFTRLEYDAVFGPGRDQHMIESTGTLSYSKPDKGSFKIDEIKRWTKKNPQDASPTAPGEYLLQKDEVGEHWVCDGKAIYEYNHRDKQLVVTRIPDELRGQNISDGPLPFLFGAEAAKLDQRYWIRIGPSNPAEIVLVAKPKWQADAANYDQVDVMLDRKTMQPKALQVYLPGGQQKHVYVFNLEKTRINETNLGEWFTGLFSAPRTPFGWTKVNAETIAPQAANPQNAIKR
ncbi:MAG: TIGR03009 domain-containing protein [Pirellulales bacterium]|nr:TIGR03009 domain-containing protein [Pirellulales bacterium]